MLLLSLQMPIGVPFAWMQANLNIHVPVLPLASLQETGLIDIVIKLILATKMGREKEEKEDKGRRSIKEWRTRKWKKCIQIRQKIKPKLKVDLDDNQHNHNLFLQNKKKEEFGLRSPANKTELGSMNLNRSLFFFRFFH